MGRRKHRIGMELNDVVTPPNNVDPFQPDDERAEEEVEDTLEMYEQTSAQVTLP